MTRLEFKKPLRKKYEMWAMMALYLYAAGLIALGQIWILRYIVSILF